MDALDHLHTPDDIGRLLGLHFQHARGQRAMAEVWACAVDLHGAVLGCRLLGPRRLPAAEALWILARSQSGRSPRPGIRFNLARDERGRLVDIVDFVAGRPRSMRVGRPDLGWAAAPFWDPG